MYELKTNNNSIPLQWGTWAMKRFCELENKTLVDLINILSSGSFELSTIINIVRASAESGHKTNKLPIEFGEFEVCEWIDEVGGLTAKDGQLIDFIKYMQNSMAPEIKDKKGKKEEKKN